MSLPAADFTDNVQVNGTGYRLLEQTKPCIYKPGVDRDTGKVEPEHHFNLCQVV